MAQNIYMCLYLFPFHSVFVFFFVFRAGWMGAIMSVHVLLIQSHANQKLAVDGSSWQKLMF